MTTSLRPLTLGELLDRTFQLYREHFVLFSGIVALPQLLILAIQLVGIATPSSGALTLTAFAVSMVTLFTMFIVANAAQAATVVAVSKVHIDQPATITQAYTSVKGRLVTLCLITIAIGLMVGAGCLLCLVPGILLALRWAVVMPVAVLEKADLRQAMSRSAELTDGQRGRVFLLYVLYFVLALVFASLWQVPVIVATALARRAGVTPAAWVPVLGAVGSFLTQCVVAPLLTIAVSLMYYDMRIRKEGFDLEHLISQVTSSSAESPAGA